MMANGIPRRTLVRLGALSGLGVIAARVPGQLAAQGAPQLPAGKDDRLAVRSGRPQDYETPTALLDSYLTPVGAFYVRSHMQTPQADAGTWRLVVDGEAPRELSLSVSDLRKLPAVSVTATLECAGNGRAFFDPPVAGVQWARGAVGTARWTGVRLRDVIAKAGGSPALTHVWAHGGDRPFGTQPPFIRHVPIEKALDPSTLVALEMNGKPLTAEHGFPIRLLVPGWEGAYSVKWLQRLTLAAKPHEGFWVSTAYRYPRGPVARGAVVPADAMDPLTGLVVKSLITRPLEGAVLRPGRVPVAGFAWAGTTRIARVDVSVDGGVTWRQAKLTGPDEPFAWRRFEFVFDAREPRPYTIRSRATDTNGRVQPVAPAWNPSGYLWNAPDEVVIEISSPGDVRNRMSLHPPPVPVAEVDRAGEAVFDRACLGCHDTGLVESQRLTTGAWERTVAKMVRWGAPVPSHETDTLVRYLAGRWGAK